MSGTSIIAQFSMPLSPRVKYFTDGSKAVLLLWIFMFFLSCVFMLLCSSVYLCLVVTCWERADRLALVRLVQSFQLSFILIILLYYRYIHFLFSNTPMKAKTVTTCSMRI